MANGEPRERIVSPELLADQNESLGPTILVHESRIMLCPIYILTAFLSLGLFIIFIHAFIITVLQKHSNNKKYHPIGGTIFHHVINFHRLHHYITDLARKYKTYRLITPFRSEVYTVDPVNVEYILKTNFENYGKGEYNNSILKDLLGDGIFTVDGEKWREQRKVSSHEFSTRVLRDYSSVVFRKSAATLARILSEAANKEESVDMQASFLIPTS
nr:cytochrome P450 704C1-like isoform X2 [Ipomoea batatas]